MQNLLLILITLTLTLGVYAPDAKAFSKDSLTWQKCTGCHAVQNGKISRIEEIRTTPEEWAVIVDRMARLHGMDLQPGEMNSLVKELCSTQGLTVEEASKVNYLDLYNNPQTVETPQANDPEKLFVTCVRCHSAGKIHSYRMTAGAWAKVRDFHLYTTPTVLGQMREMKWIDEADAVLKHLAKSQPYGKALTPSTQSPAGTWFILGYEPGKGNYQGEATIKDAANGDFAVTGAVNYADGTSESFQGDASLYGGAALRTSLSQNGHPVQGAFNFTNGTLRGQRSFPAPNYRTAKSVWYAQSSKPQVLRVSPGYLASGDTTTLILEGMNLPKVAAGDVSVGNPALKILSAKRVSDTMIEVRARSTGKDLAQTKLKVMGLMAGTLNLVPQIDYIAITPELGRARINGGPNFPAEGVQYDTIAYSKGAKANDPADDIALGPVAASYSLTELVTRPNDDDLRWLGGIGAHGTYIPVSNYGPIEVRPFHAEGVGLVKVKAQYQKDKRSYQAEARLVVTEPDFIPRIK